MRRGGYSRTYASRSGVLPPERHLTLTAKERHGLQRAADKAVWGLPMDYTGPLPRLRRGLSMAESHFTRVPQLAVSVTMVPSDP